HCIDTTDIWIDLSTTNVYSKCALLVLLLLQDVLIPLTKVTKPTLEKFIVDSSLLLWVCLTQWDRGWCNDHIIPSKNGWTIDCNVLLRDVNMAINCAKQVVRDPLGIRVWLLHDNFEAHDLTKYLAGCGL
uniref:Uncharacterized protein n=1 Tax=Oreochromis aureus TaxID=47969 RepID=A0A668U724_OREAU